MQPEDEQDAQQRAADLIAGKQVPPSVLAGLDVDGRGLLAPLVKLAILESRVVLDIDDEERPEFWLRVIISDELLGQIVDRVRAATLSGSNEQRAAAALCGDDVFNVNWDALAKVGFCDERDGQEYQRIHAAWFAEGYFNALHNYIIQKANEPAPPKTNS